MPIVFIILAIGCILVGFQGTAGQLGALLKSDFTGKDNFGLWILAFVVVGSVGYIPQLKKLSDMFILIVIVGIIFANDKGSGSSGGFFAKIQSAIQQG
jgi:hypothetical protein